MLLTKYFIIFWRIASLVMSFFTPPTRWFDADFLRFPFLHQSLFRRLTTSEKDTTFTSGDSAGSGEGDHQLTIKVEQNVCYLRFVKITSQIIIFSFRKVNLTKIDI